MKLITLTYRNKAIRIIAPERKVNKCEYWMPVSDLKAIGYNDPRSAVRRLFYEETGYVLNWKIGGVVLDGPERYHSVVSLEGVKYILENSQKEFAREFTEWLEETVIPVVEGRVRVRSIETYGYDKECKMTRPDRLAKAWMTIAVLQGHYDRLKNENAELKTRLQELETRVGNKGCPIHDLLREAKVVHV